jgi:hypothetical protein
MPAIGTVTEGLIKPGQMLQGSTTQLTKNVEAIFFPVDGYIGAECGICWRSTDARARAIQPATPLQPADIQP